MKITVDHDILILEITMVYASRVEVVDSIDYRISLRQR